MSETVYLSLGSNMGDSPANLLQAVLKLDQKGLQARDVSGMYLSEPVGFSEQPDFLNMVVAAETSHSPEEALVVCQETEREMGRVRKERWGPRPIDIDIILFGRRVIRTQDLEVPHPRMHERAFVLVPLREIAPQVLAGLETPLPLQKLILQIKSADVKMKLQELGLNL